MPNETLTPSQKKILDFIVDFYDKKKYPPSLEEIGRKFKKSKTTVYHYVKMLGSKGFIKKENYVSRGIQPKRETEIFLLGRIAAGMPIEPIENPEPIKVPDFLVKTPGNYYALEVKGNSMIDDGIFHEDIIVVKHQNTAENGNTVVAITEDGATLKKFYSLGDKIELRAENKTLADWPKQFNYGDVEIRGKFVGLIRKGR